MFNLTHLEQKQETVQPEPGKKPIWELKELCKSIANSIRELKKKRKQDTRPAGMSLDTIHSELWRARSTYRENHIAYCLLRGRTMAEIEKYDPEKPRRFRTWIVPSNVQATMSQYYIPRKIDVTSVCVSQI
jgi:hypothetical protein